MVVAVAVAVVVEKVRRVWENWVVVRYKDREVAIVLGGGGGQCSGRCGFARLTPIAPGLSLSVLKIRTLCGFFFFFFFLNGKKTWKVVNQDKKLMNK